MSDTIEFYSGTREWGWLSNLHPSPFDLDGVTWPSVEHYYQAQKTLSDLERHQIWIASTPKAAKQRGKTLTIRPHWEDLKCHVMARALLARFGPGGPDGEALDATAPRALVHTTPWGRYGDPFWGAGRQGQGQNRLGHMLMVLREHRLAHTPLSAGALVDKTEDRILREHGPASPPPAPAPRL